MGNGTATRVCVTFDLDFTWHAAGGGFIDEMAAVFPPLWALLRRYPDCKTTWFIRLDDQMLALHGSADWALTRYRNEFAELRQAGHEVGWHPHSYVQVGETWRQNTDNGRLLAELKRHAPAARSHGMSTVRMGWGFHTNEAMAFLAESGFRVDSSAMPRPQYLWEESQKDWTTTPHEPYFPACADYRIPGLPAWPILEVPMSVTLVKADYDRADILRYVNLAFHPRVLQKPLEVWLGNHPHLVTITHPYELIGGSRHGLIAFDLAAFEENLCAIPRICDAVGRPAKFLTMSDFARDVSAS
jgi:hypothetical protein